MKDIVVSLFDYTGIMVKPWLDAGYECWIVDEQHPSAYDSNGITEEGGVIKVNADLSRPFLPPFDKNRIAFVSAFPPCDHLAVSGARWFKGKGLRKLQESIAMFATAAEFCEWSGAPYFIENPVSNIASHWRKSDYTFSPDEFTEYCSDDNYTKKTCLWVGGGFVMPDKHKNHALGNPDDRIHKCPPGDDRKNIRSATPRGFANAVFFANSQELKIAV